MVTEIKLGEPQYPSGNDEDQFEDLTEEEKIRRIIINNSKNVFLINYFKEVEHDIGVCYNAEEYNTLHKRKMSIVKLFYINERENNFLIKSVKKHNPNCQSKYLKNVPSYKNFLS